MSTTYFSFLSTTSNHNFSFSFSFLHYSQPSCHSSSIPSSFFYFGSSYSHSITINMSFSLPLYISFLTWKRFVWIFYFCISTLDWWIYVFFRILFWVDAIWFCVFKLLSFFFSMTVKSYSIAYHILYIIAEAERKWIPTIKEVVTSRIPTYLKFRHV